MKYIKTLSIILSLGLFMTACETQMIEKIDLEALANGGYIRTVSPFTGGAAVSSFNVSKANMGGTKLEIVAEAVTPDKGAAFASYDLVVKFVDTTPANGNKSSATAVALKSFPASAFAKDAQTGYPRATLTVTGAEALSAVKLVDADISAGDRFEVTGTMVLSDGKKFTTTNTSPNITGGAFYSSPFFYRMPIVN